MKLPWHLLGDLSTVSYGLGVRLRATECGGAPVLNAANTFAAIEEARAHEASTHPLLTYVSKRAQVSRSDPRYAWTPNDWPEGVEIRVRSDLDGSFETVSHGVTRRVQRVPADFILGPDKVVVSWPLFGIDPNDETLKALFEVQPFGPDDYDPTTDVLGDPLLDAGDDLATGTGRGIIAPGDPDATSKLTSWAIRHLNRPDFNGFALPDTAEVVAESKDSTETWVECGDGRVVLHLGVQTPTQESAPDGEKAFKGPKYREWPCGAFGP